MRQYLAVLPIAVMLVVGVAMPAPVHATVNLPLLNPNFSIVPDAQTLGCPAGAPLSLGAVLQVAQNLINTAVSIGVIAMILVIVYAGMMFVLNPAMPEARSNARKMFINVVIGMVIVLAAWLLIDFIMKTIYNDGSIYGPWNSILVGGSACITATPPTPIGGALSAALNGTNPNQTAPSPSTTGKGACNASAITSAAASGGVTMSGQEAAILACVAGPESSCGATMQNYNWNAASKYPPSTAYGPFQITLKGNSACFNNSACSQAAGVSGPLNCASAFDSHGYAIPGTTLNQCELAAANLTCSSVAANCVYQTQGPSAWTADPNHAKQQACITSNGG